LSLQLAGATRLKQCHCGVPQHEWLYRIRCSLYRTCCSYFWCFFDTHGGAAADAADALLVCLQAAPTAKGMKVVETGADATSRQLVQMHAAVVSKFVENGMAEMHQAHPAPPGAK
jgi:hypothetical protein